MESSRKLLPCLVSLSLFATVSVYADTADRPGWTAKPFARVHLDYGIYSVDQNSDDDGLIRRARIGARGRINDHVRYRFELDALDWTFDPVDLWIQWRRPNAGGRLTFGHQQVPIGFDAMRGSERLLFLERALPTALTPGYRLGAKWEQTVSDWGGLTAGVFGDRIRSFDEIGSSLRGDASVNLRLTRVWRARTGVRMHAGLAVEQRWPDDGTVRFRSRPETQLGGLRFVDTRRIEDVRDWATMGAELAVIGERWSAKAERVSNRVRRTDLGSLSFDGWQATFTWLFADDAWRYDRRRGRITGTPPAGRWSLGFRLSELDLRSREVDGGFERNLTISGSRRFNDWLRLLVEAGHANGRDRRGDSFEHRRFQFRLQAYFR